MKEKVKLMEENLKGIISFILRKKIINALMLLFEFLKPNPNYQKTLFSCFETDFRDKCS
jgi:hypothetical protein